MSEDFELKNTKILAETGFWGSEGAGAILFSPDRGKFGLGLRSINVLEPGTLGTFGGAIDGSYTPEETVQNELMEEVGIIVPPTLMPLMIFRQDDFIYHNYIAIIDDKYFDPVLNWENDEIVWMSMEEIESNENLHFGIKSVLADDESILKMRKIENANANHKDIGEDFSY